MGDDPDAGSSNSRCLTPTSSAVREGELMYPWLANPDLSKYEAEYPNEELDDEATCQEQSSDSTPDEHVDEQDTSPYFHDMEQMRDREPSISTQERASLQPHSIEAAGSPESKTSESKVDEIDLPLQVLVDLPPHHAMFDPALETLVAHAFLNVTPPISMTLQEQRAWLIDELRGRALKDGTKLMVISERLKKAQAPCVVDWLRNVVGDQQMLQQIAHALLPCAGDARTSSTVDAHVTGLKTPSLSPAGDAYHDAHM